MTPARLRPPGACSVGRAIGAVGDAWSILVLRAAFFGVRRFEAFQEALGAPREILSERLAHLTAAGLLMRVRYRDAPPRDEYRLAQMAHDLYPAIVLLLAWGERWRPDPADGLTLTHACGQRLRAVMRCGVCDAPLAARDVTASPGPGAGGAGPPPARRPRRIAEDGAILRAGAAGRALAAIGDRWSFLILREAFFGARRFSDLAAGTGIARNILAGRLTRLTGHGVLERRACRARPARLEYRLSSQGLDLYGASLALLAWGDAWLGDGSGAPVVLTHRLCGAAFGPRAACAACAATIRARDVVVETNGLRPAQAPSPAIAAAGMARRAGRDPAADGVVHGGERGDPDRDDGNRPRLAQNASVTPACGEGRGGPDPVSQRWERAR